MTTRRHYRCRFCDIVLPAWYDVPGEPNGAMLLHHMSQSHPAELKPFLAQMQTTDDITPAIVPAFEVIEDGRAEVRPGRGDRQEGVSRVAWRPDRAT
jgi:hypothetical protein